jgi:hypothetical protein
MKANMVLNRLDSRSFIDGRIKDGDEVVGCMRRPTLVPGTHFY